MINRLIILCFYISISIGYLTAFAEEEAYEIIPPNALHEPLEIPASSTKIVTLMIKGLISKNTLKQVKESAPLNEEDPIPAGFIVLLDSPGGDGVAAMELGRFLRKARAHVFVTGRCASACVFVLASGVVRGADVDSVGIHRGRLTVSDKNAKILKEIDTAQNFNAMKILSNFEKVTEKYFTEMGIPTYLLDDMQLIESTTVKWLNEDDLKKYNLIGFDPNYFDVRAKFYRERFGLYFLSGDQLVERTNLVAPRCKAYEKETFIECYRDLLKNSYDPT